MKITRSVFNQIYNLNKSKHKYDQTKYRISNLHVLHSASVPTAAIDSSCYNDG